ncbi:Com family DNA-binding transcriptional regulator [Oxalobacter aliiformigenes]|uniref:Com family DNA-binding transcriptional regulator n=1 Tax=Oxalobacter aliiformigenes TaxID=2946593 RepID=UPI0022B02A77|nr:Com family DNA-binding transcriptional regulator [Oxalobacter aliiformigenes]MCZ4065658.1 Com family DNA-binding transcriptional regulator [Oxalobacter aliiformigenes]WAV98329.1 Com family DNA-binding transcriptional regulator [Oxalobacter aliiformigenes]
MEIRCKGCNRKIAEANGNNLTLFFKCPRCRVFNQFYLKAIEPLASTPRASTMKGNDNEQSDQTRHSVDRWKT